MTPLEFPFISIRPYRTAETEVLTLPFQLTVVVPVRPTPVVRAAIATPDVTGAFTVKDWETFVAGAYVTFPACDAMMLQVLVAKNVMTNPETVHTLGVIEVNRTGRAEVEVGAAEYGVPTNCVPGFVKVIVCAVPEETGNETVTGKAAAKDALPACVPVISHVPLAIVKISKPLTEQIPGVFDVRVTVRPDVAVAPEVSLTPGD